MLKNKLLSLIFFYLLFTISTHAKEPSELINEIVNEASKILSSSDPVESKIIKLIKMTFGSFWAILVGMPIN